MAFKYKLFLVISPLVLILDQVTKHFIKINIFPGQRLAIIDGVFDIVNYTNRGAAFGMFSGDWSSSFRTPFFYTVSVVALVAIIIYVIKLPDTERLMPFALSLVVGGIFGNGMDRVRFGEVTDFLSLHIGDKILWGFHLEWPAFNVADSAITVAMVLLIIGTFKSSHHRTIAPSH